MTKTTTRFAEITSGAVMAVCIIAMICGTISANGVVVASSALLFFMTAVLLVRNIVTTKKGGAAAAWN